MRERLALLLFPPLALVSPVIEAFGTLSIPLLSVPSLSLFGSLAGVGLLLGTAAAMLRPAESSHLPRRLLYVTVLAATLLVILDVALGGHRVLMTAADSRIGRLCVLLALGALLSGALWLTHRRVAPLLLVVSAAFLVSTLVLNLPVLSVRSGSAPNASPSPASTALPPILYIVIDEAMGVDGIAGSPGGGPLAAELRTLFRNRGFRLHGGAFSRHYASSRSIPNTLNFDFSDDSWGQTLRHHENSRVRSALFEQLAHEGYKVVSYGTEHIDFCFTVAARCEVLPSFNPASPYLERLRTRDLYHVMWRTFAESYLVFRYISLVFHLTAWPASTFAGFDAQAFPRWFDRFEADITTHPRGHAYFAHLVMPHAPYLLDSACHQTGSKGESYYMLAELRSLEPPRLDEVRAEGYRQYQAQYRCLAGRLEGLLDRIDATPEFDGATIVIHGDHGSRISAGQYEEHLSDRDLIDNYSTFYAIRRPDVDAGYDSRRTSVQRLTAEYLSGRRATLGPDDGTVAIDSVTAGKVIVRAMPEFAPLPPAQ